MLKVELFLDDQMLSCQRNVGRRVETPAKHPKNPILQSEYPWEEDYVTVYGSVLRNETDTGFRMWYMSGLGKKEQMMNYAESEDGINWQKPRLDITSYRDCKQTNILLGPEVNIHGPCVLRNPLEGKPDERYLVFYDSYSKYRPEVPEVQSVFRWTYTATSPDGLHWSPRQGRPAVAGKSDTGQSVVWDPIRKRFLAYMRGVLDEHGTRVRYVRCAESEDFEHWENERELLRADERDGGARGQLHQLSVTKYHDVYIGLLSLFHIDDVYSTPEHPIFEEGKCDAQLVVSRDGVHWQRVADRAVFLPLGEDGQWDSQWIVTASQMLLYDDKVWIYYAATDRTRSQGHRYQIGLAQLPRDRFVSLGPRHEGEDGYIELKPQHYGTGDLAVNADASKGQIQVELRTLEDKILDGFSRHDCTGIVGDDLNHAVHWQGKALRDATIEHNGPLRMRLYLCQARIFALLFDERMSPAEKPR
jgi:hypothetical protein